MELAFWLSVAWLAKSSAAVVLLLGVLAAEEGLAKNLGRRRQSRIRCSLPAQKFLPIRRAADLYDSQRRGPGDYAAVSEKQAVRIFQSAAGGTPTINYDPRQPAPGIQSFVSKRSSRPAARISVKPVNQGKSGAKVFFVKEARSTRVLKIFGNVESMLREASAIQTIQRLKLKHLHTARLLGVTLATDGKGKQVGATLQSRARGRSIDDQMSRTGRARGETRTSEMNRLTEMTRQVAIGLADLHNAGTGRKLTRKDKMDNDVVWFLRSWGELKRNPRLDRNLFATLNAKARGVVSNYLRAPITGTVTHGDARGANFFVDGKNRVTAIDNETVMRSVFNGVGVGSFAGDLGRFLETMAIVGREKRISPAEIRQVQRAFMSAYRKSTGSRLAINSSQRPATKFFQVNMAAVALKNDLRDYPAADPKVLPSYQRLLQLLR